MKITVITPTCRKDGRLLEMAAALAAAARERPDVELEWVVVYESFFDVELADAIADRLKHGKLHLVAAPPTKHRTQEPKRPAHNSARNTGLAIATGDYVALLNDCNLVTIGWVDMVADCAAAGLGFRCALHQQTDLAMPPDGRIMKGSKGAFCDVRPTAVASASWGAPKGAFDQIHGFDTAYDGERKYNDVDAIIRLSRVGVRFVTSSRAHTIQLTKTKIAAEITSDPDAFSGIQNTKRFGELTADAARVLPAAVVVAPDILPVADPQAAPPADAGTEAPVDAGDAGAVDAPRAREEVAAENALLDDLGVTDDFDYGGADA